MRNQVGIFFCIDNVIVFRGCNLDEADYIKDYENYSCPDNHVDWWDAEYRDKYGAEFDFYPRGQITYSGETQTFCISYDKCIPQTVIEEFIREYNSEQVKLVSDESFLCHKCNKNYEKELAERTSCRNYEKNILKDKVPKWYVYLSHSFDEVIFSKTYRTRGARYCLTCNAEDKLVAVCENDAELDKVLFELAKEHGFSGVSDSEYDYEEIVKKYGFMQ